MKTDALSQALQSMRPQVEEMLVRNGFNQDDYCPSQHHRCGQFIDSQDIRIIAANAGGVKGRMEFRKSQVGCDIALARTFRKVWEVCQMVQDFERGTDVAKSIWACKAIPGNR